MNERLEKQANVKFSNKLGTSPKDIKHTSFHHLHDRNNNEPQLNEDTNHYTYRSGQ